MRPGWAETLADVGVGAAARPAGRDRRADGGRRGPAGDRAGHDRDRRREGVHLRDLHPGMRPAGHLGAAGPAPDPDRQGDRGGDVRVGQHVVLPARGRLYGPEPGPARHRDAEQAAWTLPELQDLLDEWLLAGWQARPHDALRDPLLPRRALSPNEKYAALVAAAGYLPLTAVRGGLPGAAAGDLAADQRLRHPDRLPHLRLRGPGSWRLQHSGITARKGLWEVHYDPYDLSRVFVRTPGGWVTVPWTHLPMVSAPFAEFTWRHARRAGRQHAAWMTPARPRSPGCWTTCSPGRRPARWTRPAPGSPPAPRAAAAAHRPPAAEEHRDGDGGADDAGHRLPRSSRWSRSGIFDADAEADAAVTPRPGSGMTADEPLTTKEGWRRFVRHAAGPAGAAAAAALARDDGAERARYDEARQAYHADLPLANTPVIQKVIATSPAADPAEPAPGLGPPRRDRRRRVRHREDHRADPAGPHPRAASPASGIPAMTPGCRSST